MRTMPKFKKNEIEFVVSVYWSGKQYLATIPKVLVDRVKTTKGHASGSFVFDGETLKLIVTHETS